MEQDGSSAPAALLDIGSVAIGARCRRAGGARRARGRRVRVASLSRPGRYAVASVSRPGRDPGALQSHSGQNPATRSTFSTSHRRQQGYPSKQSVDETPNPGRRFEQIDYESNFSASPFFLRGQRVPGAGFEIGDRDAVAVLSWPGAKRACFRCICESDHGDVEAPPMNRGKADGPRSGHSLGNQARSILQ
ncbi:MAG TPA: hypothetical protein VM657_13785 [Sphingomonas sp.]|nr:hypothetical protein [Sphingomonas sp.]